MISIIIPVYNAAEFLPKCLDSVLGQTLTDLEVILINDGSKDNSLTICQDYQQKDSRVRVITQPNSGVSRARNRGIAEAKGEFLFFVDADDWLDTDCLEALMGAMKEDTDLACCGCMIESADESKRRDTFPDAVLTGEQALDTMSPYFWSVIWGKLIRRSICECTLFDEDLFYSEDTLAYCRLLTRAKKVFWTSKPYYHYWTNPNGAMKLPNPQRLYTEFIARGRIAALLADDRNRYEDALIWQVEAAMKVYKFYLDVDYNPKAQKELRAFIEAHKNLLIASAREEATKSWLKKLLRYSMIYKMVGKLKKLSGKGVI